MFQVPKSTHIVILCGIEAVQMRAQKKSELEKLFFRRALLQLSFLAIPANFVVYFLIFGKAAKDRMAQSAARRAKAPKSLFSPSFWGKQCSRSDWKQSKHAREKKKNGA